MGSGLPVLAPHVVCALSGREQNNLPLWESDAPVSLQDCEALVQQADPSISLGAKSSWELAGLLAFRMLPQIFQSQSPVFALNFAPVHQRRLEHLLAALPPGILRHNEKPELNVT